MSSASDACRRGWRARASASVIRARIRGSAWWRRLLLPGATITGLIVTVYAITELARSLGVASEEDWTLWEPLGVTLLVSGALSLVGVLLVVTGYRRYLTKDKADDDLLTCCKGIWALIVPLTGLDMTKVGVHVWGVRGPRGFRHLERRATFAIGRRRRTRVTWTLGKGAIGIAWKLDTPIVASMSDLETLAAGDVETFCALAEETRFGLTWQEFENSRHYRCILAVPLRAGEENALVVRGVLSVDISADGHASLLRTIHRHDAFLDIVSTCETVLSGRR